MLFLWRQVRDIQSLNLCIFIGLVIYSNHKVLKRIIRTFIVLAGLQYKCNRVTNFLLIHDDMPSYRNGVLPLIRITPLFNLISSVNTFDFILPQSLNLCFIINCAILVLEIISHLTRYTELLGVCEKSSDGSDPT